MKKGLGRNVYFHELESEKDGFLGVFWDKDKAIAIGLRTIGAASGAGAPEIDYEGPRMKMSFQGQSVVITTHPRYTNVRMIPSDSLLERLKLWH